MFRDSRGVVHTVSSPDPLADLPSGAAGALQAALLRPVHGDLGGALERCDAARELLERWQDAFFDALPDEVDLREEARWAAEAGLSLEDVEAGFEDPGEDDELDDEPYDEDAIGGLLDLEDAEPDEAEDPRTVLPSELVTLLERELLLLPLRVRLEALVAAGDLVDGWAALLADHEKLLGHLVLAHAEPQAVTGHERLADRHASLHAGGGAIH